MTVRQEKNIFMNTIHGKSWIVLHDVKIECGEKISATNEPPGCPL